MADFIPMFPLKIVAFPGEKVSLHIFEPRYLQLIGDVMDQSQVFGIPVFIRQMASHGTLVRLDKIIREYDDGRIDITAVGQSVFKIQQFVNPLTGKLYGGALIEPVINIEDGDIGLTNKIKYELEHLLNNANLQREVTMTGQIDSYHIAHIIGLSLEEEYHLLTLSHERDRQQYILHHLEKIIPQVDKLKEIRRRIGGNGHF